MRNDENEDESEYEVDMEVCYICEKTDDDTFNIEDENKVSVEWSVCPACSLRYHTTKCNLYLL